ncbi:hypothetical protein LCGC14_1219000, partial [marine sediment metagenome]
MKKVDKVIIAIIISLLSILFVSAQQGNSYNWVRGAACLLSGCTMEGDINMGGNSIINANWVNTTFSNASEICINNTCIDDWDEINVTPVPSVSHWNASAGKLFPANSTLALNITGINITVQTIRTGAGNNLTITLGDNLGKTNITIEDSDGVALVSIDTNGLLYTHGGDADLVVGGQDFTLSRDRGGSGFFTLKDVGGVFNFAVGGTTSFGFGAGGRFDMQGDMTWRTGLQRTLDLGGIFGSNFQLSNFQGTLGRVTGDPFLWSFVGSNTATPSEYRLELADDDALNANRTVNIGTSKGTGNTINIINIGKEDNDTITINGTIKTKGDFELDGHFEAVSANFSGDLNISGRITHEGDRVNDYIPVYSQENVMRKIDNSLVLDMHFDNRSIYGENNSLFVDFSGNANNGTCVGGGCPNYTDGKIGRALEFDGDGDYIEIADDDSLDLSTAATWSLWVKRAQYTDLGGLLNKYFSAGGRRSYTLLEATGGDSTEIGLFLSPNGATPDVYYTTNNCGPVDDEWTYIAVTYDEGSAIYYKNGVQCDTDSGSVTSIHNSPEPLLIGSSYDSDFNGTIDEVKVFNRVLSAEEINDMYLNEKEFYRDELRANSLGIGTGRKSLHTLEVGGSMNVSGDLNVSGNILSSNVFLPQYIFSHTNETIPLRGASLWTNV